MNKKIIAIAVAAAVSAPAAMADVKVGGQIGAALIQGSKGYVSQTAKGLGFTASDNTTTYRGMADSGLSKLEFSGTAGDASFKVAMDIRQIMGGGATGGRDFWIGHKLGGGTLSFGRMGAALAGLEGDKYNATFLELRRTAAVATTEKSSTDTFLSMPVLQYAVKAGSAAIKVQYDPSDNNGATDGYFGLSVKGKAGPVGYFAGVNNGKGSTTNATAQSSVLNADGTITTTAAAAKKTEKDQNIKVGASMKFGAAKVTAMMMNADNDSVKSSATTIFADIGVGSGMSVGVGYGMQTSGAANKDTFMRLALTKNLSKKASIFGGYVAYHDDNGATKDTNAMGVGMKVKF